MYKYVVFTAFVALFQFGHGQEDSSCQTPTQAPGNCISIKSCDSLLHLLRTQSSNSEIRTFLRKSVCGYVGTTPKVCCPLQRSLVIPASSNGQTRSAPASELPEPPNCGYSSASVPRVVGGIPAKLGEFPWMVAIGYRNPRDPNTAKWLCGGSLITYRHVLTAAHCDRDDLYLARIGDLDLYDDDDGATPVDIPVVKKKIHENYDATAHINDIALLTLEKPVDDKIGRPICLPLSEALRKKNFNKFNVFIAGWGAIQFRGPASAVLQLASLPVVTTEFCKEKLANFKTTIDNTVICAGQGGKDACQGDSGGPLMYGKPSNTSFNFYQIGVVSYGYKCAEIGYPGVYTRVTEFLDWIQNNL